MKNPSHREHIARNVKLLREATDAETALALERSLLRETDNGPRPEDGDQSLAVAPPQLRRLKRWATAAPVDRVLGRARALLGDYEHPDGSNHVPGITDWYGIDYAPWCAMTVSRIFFDAGFVEAVNFTTSKGFAYCPSGIDGFRARKQWHAGKVGIRAGDVIFYDWEGDGVSDHVGTVEYVDSAGVHTIEGNSDNRCERRLRNANIVGFGRPAFAVKPAPTPVPKEVDVKLIQVKGRPEVYVTDGATRGHIPSPAVFKRMGFKAADIQPVAANDLLMQLPLVGTAPAKAPRRKGSKA